MQNPNNTVCVAGYEAWKKASQDAQPCLKKYPNPSRQLALCYCKNKEDFFRATDAMTKCLTTSGCTCSAADEKIAGKDFTNQCIALSGLFKTTQTMSGGLCPRTP